MELTAEQRQVVDHGEGWLRVRGRAGTGKTTALVARYLRLAREVPASRVLVVCRSREAVLGFRDAVVPELAGGFDALPIATFAGVAFDVLGRRGERPTLVTAGEQRAVVRGLLDGEGSAEWPTLHAFVHRGAFVDEVIDGLVHWQTTDAHLLDTELDERWRELAGFAERYRQVLDAQGAVDFAGLLTRAAALLEQESVGYEHVLVDDFEGATAATDRILRLLTATSASACLSANPDAAFGSQGGADVAYFEVASGPGMELTERFRQPAVTELVRCIHPSIEPEAVAGELLAARDAGARWSEMAVLVRRPRRRARAIARALARHGIPVVAATSLEDEPVVTATIDVLRWAAGDEAAFDRLLSSPLSGLDAAAVRAMRRQARDEGFDLADHPSLGPLAALRRELAERIDADDPAELVFHIWERALGPVLVSSNDPADERALDAFVAFHDGVARQVERHPGLRLGQWLASIDGRGDAWRSTRPLTDAVTVASVSAAAGRQWHTVVIAGAVEGELPAVHAHRPLFDPAGLSGQPGPTVAERRRRSLAEERRLFCEVAATRATAALIATAAPEPGVLESRFVEAWPARPPRLPLAPGRPPIVRPPTDGAEALFPDHALNLSASQLDVYEDCPLRYFYEYVLQVRGDTNVYAELGSLVHETLAAFLDPNAEEPVDFSLDGLRALGEQMWRDDLARYRPQVEEARRDYFDMLEHWWNEEGALGHPDVVAVERRFEVEVGPHRITGSIDRIDRRNGGLRILDYKTGSRETPVDDMPDNVQLAVYHLAACRDPELAECGPASELDLMFLRSMKVRTQPVTADHEATTEARVLAVADRIIAEDFEPSVHANCRVCAFHRLCPIQAAGRETAPDA